MPTATVEKTSDSELVITRIFDAPRELVWRAWTQSEHLAKWICPSDATVICAEGDVRIGGKWRSGMRMDNGEENFMGGEYREVEPPQRLVFTHGWEDSTLHPGHMTTVCVQLLDDAGRTKMIFTHSDLPTPESRDGHIFGWSGAFDHLAAHLETLI